MAQTILVVDDDDLLRQSLAFLLQQAGYAVETAASIQVATAILEQNPTDLILLDVEMPGGDGRELLRALHGRVSVILVTARRRELDEVLGLELGAVDYITKPFSKDVLLARVRSALRRQEPPSTAQPAQVVVGDLMIDVAAHQVTLKGKKIKLAPLEFRLLHTLAQAPGRVFSPDDLLEQVWGHSYEGEQQIVYVYMRELRRKLEQDPQHPQRLVTIRSVGYKLVSQDL